MYIKAIHANKENITPYGTFYNLYVPRPENEPWASCISADELINDSVKIGFVRAKSLPVEITELERHTLTKEVMITANTPVVVVLGKPTLDQQAPKCQELMAFIMEIGDVICINEGVWHSPCFGVDHEAHYYFLYHPTEEPNLWTKIVGAPCTLKF